MALLLLCWDENLTEYSINKISIISFFFFHKNQSWSQSGQQFIIFLAP